MRPGRSPGRQNYWHRHDGCLSKKKKNTEKIQMRTGQCQVPNCSPTSRPWSSSFSLWASGPVLTKELEDIKKLKKNTTHICNWKVFSPLTSFEKRFKSHLTNIDEYKTLLNWSHFLKICYLWKFVKSVLTKNTEICLVFLQNFLNESRRLKSTVLKYDIAIISF